MQVVAFYLRQPHPGSGNASRPIAREALAANEKVDWLHLRSTWPDPATLFVCKRKRFIFRGCLSNFPFHTTSTPLGLCRHSVPSITNVGRNKQCILSPWFFSFSSSSIRVYLPVGFRAFQTKPNLTWPTYLNDLPSHNRISQLWPTPITSITVRIYSFCPVDPLGMHLTTWPSNLTYPPENAN